MLLYTHDGRHGSACVLLGDRISRRRRSVLVVVGWDSGNIVTRRSRGFRFIYESGGQRRVRSGATRRRRHAAGGAGGEHRRRTDPRGEGRRIWRKIDF